MSTPLRILFVVDSTDEFALLDQLIRRAGHIPTVKRVDCPETLKNSLRNEEWDVVVSQFTLALFQRLEPLTIVQSIEPDLPFILIARNEDEDQIADIISDGVSDYVMMGNLVRFVPALLNAIHVAEERSKHRRGIVSLRESQSMLSLVYNNVTDRLVLFALLPDGSYRVVSVNRTALEFARKILGMPSYPNLAGKRMEELVETVLNFTPAEVMDLRERCNLAIRSGETHTFETSFHVGGRHLHIELSLIPVKSNESGTQHLLWVCRDITSRKEAEDRQRSLEVQLQQSRKLEALGQLAGGIAHDFNNLLTSILGYGELVKSATSGLVDVRNEVEGILSAANRAKDLVRQILSFSRSETPIRKRVHLEPMVRETLNLMKSSAPAGIAFECYIMPDLPAIMGDEKQLQQVLLNIATNAIQAMGERGRLSLSLEAVHVDKEFARNHPPLTAGEFIRLSVSDTGSGMTVNAMDHLFEPFFTTKPVGMGTGLGLAVVHGIVRAHQGTISVYSREGEGTTFQIYFPVGTSSTPTNQNADIPRGHGEQILFVDDEIGIMNLATTVLEQIGYKPVSLNSSIEALRVFQAEPDRFAAVITDLTMPGMTGTELAKQIHEIRPGIPIILTSGYSGAIDEGRASRSGFVKILGKPFPMRLLAETLENVLAEYNNSLARKGSE